MAVPRNKGIVPPRERCNKVPADIPTTDTTIATTAPAVIPLTPAFSRSMTTATTPPSPHPTPIHWRGRNFSLNNKSAPTEVTTGCRPAMSADSPDGKPRSEAMNTPPR